MNTFKKTGGFTLVELIIVIAILAILSSVAVAGYSAYITKANDTAAEAFLGELVTQATLANAEAGPIDEILVDVTVSGQTTTVTVYVKAASFAKDFNTDIAYRASEVTGTQYRVLTNVTVPSALFNSKYKADAKWENGTWTAETVTAPTPVNNNNN